jgi:hypothetical protein
MNAMVTHVKVLAIIHIIFGILGILIGVAAFAFFGGIAGLISMDADPDAAIAVPLVGSLGGIVLFVLLIFSAPSIIAGAGLLSFRPWARILMLVISVLDLVNIPVGTALGVYGMWVLLSKDGAALFEQTGAAPSVQY